MPDMTDDMTAAIALLRREAKERTEQAVEMHADAVSMAEVADTYDAEAREMERAAAYIQTTVLIDPPPLDPDVGEPEQPPPVPPRAFGDVVTVRQGGSVPLTLLANDEAGDAPLASATIVRAPEHGTLSADLTTYTPTTGYSGSDSFEYVALDTAGMSSQPAAVSITVTPVAPPPPPPTVKHERRLLGMAPAAAQYAGQPIDSMAALESRLEVALNGGRKFKLVSIFGLGDQINLLKPGRGYRANLYPTLTQQGRIALVTVPMLWRKVGPDGGGPGDFRSVIAGKFDRAHIDFFKHLEDSGQGNCRIRIAHEADDGRSQPWGCAHDFHGIGHKQNFVLHRQACNHVVELAKKHLPNAMISRSHFSRTAVKYNDGTVTKEFSIHPDEISFDPDLADCIGVDWYDGKGKAMVNEAAWNKEANAVGQHGEPVGINKWAAYAKGHGKPFCVDEWGLMIRPDMSPAQKLERDNPFFVRKMWELYLALGNEVAHWAYFHLGDTTSRLVPTTQAGTRKATDEFMRTFGRAV